MVEITDGPAVEGGLLEKTVVLMLELGRLGTRAKVNTDDVQVEADKDMLHVSKDILTSPELKDVSSHDHSVRAFIKSRSLPSYLKGGFYLVPVAALEQIDGQLVALQTEREELIEKFLTAYPAAAESAKERLGILYREADYPSSAKVRSTFTWRARYMTFSTPSSLKGISKALFEREAAKAQSEMRAAVDDIKILLRAELKGLVDHLLERLTPESDGKAKVFRGSLVGNVKQWLDLLDGRNVVGDVDLSALAGEARGLLDGIDAEALRKDEAVRGAVAVGFEKLKAALDPLVAAKPKRMIEVE